MFCGAYPKHNGTMTGTSSSASIVAGACALMLQWGIANENYEELNTFRVRSLLIKCCNREPNVEYPNEQWGYGRLDLASVLRSLI